MFCALLLTTWMTAAGVAPDHANEIMEWRVSRLASLTRPYGWLSLVGLHWLEPGENRLGQAADNDVILNAGPDHLGAIRIADGEIIFTAADGVTVTAGDGQPLDEIAVATDLQEDTTVLNAGAVQLYVIERAGELGVRVKDPVAPTRTDFVGLDYFPVHAGWRIEARFIAHEPGKTMPVGNVLGHVDDTANPGKLVFEVEGKEYELEAVEEAGEEDLFIIFGDRTNGKTTYGAGRFVYVEWPADGGTTVLDFNKAYNPPCVFTDYSTCPLPPQSNRLPLVIEAGEKDYAPGHKP